jgi:hypothetical protein
LTEPKPGKLGRLVTWIESPPTLIAAAAVVVATVITAVVGPLEREDILGGAAALSTYLGSEVPLPRWGAGALGLGSLIAVAFLGRPLVERVRALQRRKGSSHLSYRIDTIEGIRWRWSWETFGIKVSSIECFCPVCDHELERRHQRHPGGRTECWWFCPRCDKAASSVMPDFQTLENRVRFEIERQGRARVGAG